MNEELNAQTLKLNLTVEKAEISFQQYELLYYEISTIKKSLLDKGKLITKENLNKIIQLKKPNEAIYLLMNMFVKIISVFEQKEINSNLSWDYIKNNISFSKYSNFLLYLSKSGNFEMDKQNLDEAMPFLVNYEKLETPIKELGEEYLPILIFIKTSVDYNIKLNIIKDLYNSNLNKNKKINTLQMEVNKLNNLIHKVLTLQEEINNELNELCKLKDSKEEFKKFKLILLKKYNLYEKYNVNVEISKQNKEKVIIKLKPNYKLREKFIEQLLNSNLIYLEKKNEDFNESLISYLMNDDIKNIYNVKKLDYKHFKISNKNLKIENYFSKLKLKPKTEKDKNDLQNKTHSLIYNDKNKFSNLNKDIKTLVNKDINSYFNKDNNNINNHQNKKDEYDDTREYVKNNQQRKRNIPSNIRDDDKFCNYFCCKSFN